MPRRKTTWVLVADGARARMLLAKGRGQGLEPVAEAEWRPSREPTRELGTDKPGRAFESASPGLRHAMEPKVAWQRFEKARFAREVAEMLAEAARREAFDAIVIVAPPQALGDLRAILDAAVAARITAEIPKDLTNVPLHDLPRHLAEVAPC